MTAKKKARRKVDKRAEDLFYTLCAASPHVPRPEREHRFHPTRRWRFDFAWPDHGLAVEIEGGVFVRGRHNRGASYIADCEKYNEATLLHWYVLRFPTNWVPNGRALLETERAFSVLSSPQNPDPG